MRPPADPGPGYSDLADFMLCWGEVQQQVGTISPVLMRATARPRWRVLTLSEARIALSMPPSSLTILASRPEYIANITLANDTSCGAFLYPECARFEWRGLVNSLHQKRDTTVEPALSGDGPR